MTLKSKARDRALTPKTFHTEIVVPGLDLLHDLGGPERSNKAEILLVAIAGQESNWEHRVQRVKTTKGWRDGPARGYWQFERMGGVIGVLTHPSSRVLARACCAECGVEPEPVPVHLALSENDLLACCFARLLLWTDPRPLPSGQWDCWDYYLKNWRPGKPHRVRWPAAYKAGLEVTA
jgi:hypothetical protein